MTVVMAHEVVVSLLQYYKQLRTNPKYKITLGRAWEKYSMFFNYLDSGIIADLPKGRFCKYRDMGQKYNKGCSPKFPTLKYISYQDASKTQWYISYIYNAEDDILTIVRIKVSRLVKCETDKSITCSLNEDKLRRIITKTITQMLKEELNRNNPRKIGNWKCIPSNGYEFHDIPSKGKCVGIAMYVNNTTNEKIPPTYCLFRRGSNGKYFYATIVDAPEKGPKETKFLTVPVSNVPQEIRKDLHNLNLLS